MTVSKVIIPCLFMALSLGACGQNTATSPEPPTSETISSESKAEILVWEGLMPEGEDKVLATLTQATKTEGAEKPEGDIMSMIGEGSAQDTMDQIGTYNVVQDLDGTLIRLPGYVVPLDFNAASEYNEFLLVPYFGACLHTPPPPPNQIVFIKSEQATTIANINEPVWVEGIMKTGKFGSDLGNSAYELTLAKLEPYEY